MTDHAQDAPVPDPGCLGVSANTMGCAVLYRDGSSGGANYRVLWRRWKTESGFKEIKQEIGRSKSQTCNARAVINDINFSMMATTMTWLNAIQLENNLEGRHQIESRNSFAFSDLRHIVAKTALCDNFNAVCNKKEKLR